MPKGMFTQGVSVLLDRPVTLDEMEAALSGFEVRGRVEEVESWEFGGPTLIVAYRPDVNGMVAVDVVDRVWPDQMGDPEQEATLFGAWSMGNFGPFAFPGSLARAAEQSWAWEAGRAVPDRHRAFLRIRSSYVFGSSEDTPLAPSDYEPLAELDFLTKLASALLELPNALCYFNPNGEVLLDADHLRETLNYGWSNQLPPLDAWSNVRLFRVNEDWSMMDTVGNGQLDIPDVEACFHLDSYDIDPVANFLRNVSLYALKNGDVIEDGDTMDGPGGVRWQSRRFEDSICDPPRDVLRWLPIDGREAPAELEDAGGPPEE